MPGGIRIEAPHRRRSCTGNFVAAAWLVPASADLRVELDWVESRPSRCLCVGDVDVLIRLDPGAYTVRGLGGGTGTRVTVPPADAEVSHAAR